MRILVTGGSGFIGSSLVPALQAGGHEVVVYDLSPPDDADTPRIIGDIRDGLALAGAMRTIDTVVHFAAVSGVKDCEELPLFAAHTNIGVKVMLEAERAGVKRLVYASSMAARDGDSWYGATKKAQEALAHAMTQRGKLDCIGMRFANVYGPHSWNKSSVVATWMRAALRGEPLEVHGSGYQERDFIHVDDVCAEVIRALGADGSIPEVYPVFSGVNTRIGQMAALVSQITGAAVDHRGGKGWGMPGATMLTGATPLESGIAATWQWFQEEAQRRSTEEAA